MTNQDFREIGAPETAAEEPPVPRSASRFELDHVLPPPPLSPAQGGRDKTGRRSAPVVGGGARIREDTSMIKPVLQKAGAAARSSPEGERPARLGGMRWRAAALVPLVLGGALGAVQLMPLFQPAAAGLQRAAAATSAQVLPLPAPWKTEPSSLRPAPPVLARVSAPPGAPARDDADLVPYRPGSEPALPPQPAAKPVETSNGPVLPPPSVVPAQGGRDTAAPTKRKLKLIASPWALTHESFGADAGMVPAAAGFGNAHVVAGNPGAGAVAVGVVWGLVVSPAAQAAAGASAAPAAIGGGFACPVCGK